LCFSTAAVALAERIEHLAESVLADNNALRSVEVLEVMREGAPRFRVSVIRVSSFDIRR
jgi:hypothetical protein